MRTLTPSRVIEQCAASYKEEARAFQNLEGAGLTLEQNGLDENGGRLKLRPSGRQSGI